MKSWFLKPTGTLVLDDLNPGKNLYLLSSGTGLAPFLATIRDPETYERFEKSLWFMVPVLSLNWLIKI